jgi:hypothetical protein
MVVQERASGDSRAKEDIIGAAEPELAALSVAATRVGRAREIVVVGCEQARDEASLAAHARRYGLSVFALRHFRRQWRWNGHCAAALQPRAYVAEALAWLEAHEVLIGALEKDLTESRAAPREASTADPAGLREGCLAGLRGLADLERAREGLGERAREEVNCAVELAMDPRLRGDPGRAAEVRELLARLAHGEGDLDLPALLSLSSTQAARLIAVGGLARRLATMPEPTRSMASGELAQLWVPPSDALAAEVRERLELVKLVLVDFSSERAADGQSREAELVARLAGLEPAALRLWEARALAVDPRRVQTRVVQSLPRLEAVVAALPGLRFAMGPGGSAIPAPAAGNPERSPPAVRSEASGEQAMQVVSQATRQQPKPTPQESMTASAMPLEPSIVEPGKARGSRPTDPPLQVAAELAAPRDFADLFSTEIYRSQKALAQRIALPDDVLLKMLRALADRGGKLTIAALAAGIGSDEVRVLGILAAARRVLNVDQADVLSIDQGSSTVALDAALLWRQFRRG